MGEEAELTRRTGEAKERQMVALLFAAVTASRSLQGMGGAGGLLAMGDGIRIVSDVVAQWRSDVIKRTEDSILACFPDAVAAVKAAIGMQKATAGKRDGSASLSVRVAIHYGEGRAGADGLRGDAAAFAAEALLVAKANHIYISPEVLHAVGDLQAVEFRPVTLPGRVASGHPSFYDVVWSPEADCAPRPESVRTPPAGSRDGAEEPSWLFAHGAALLEGQNEPCFYCGSRKHATTACPSKHLPYGAQALEALGRLSVEEINGLFSTYLCKAGGDLPVIPATEGEDPIHLAPLGFYELKRPFQLRFLNLVWSAGPREDWHKVKATRRETSARGGLLWMARDCIRISELDKAEDLLRRYGRENQKDCRTACGLGFIKIEEGSYLSAVDLFNLALSQEPTPLQKTHLFLLLSRVHDLTGHPDRGAEALKEALKIEPYCLEAKFEEVVLYFRLTRTPEAVARLLKLLHLSREYYSAALISPDLAQFQSFLAPELRKLVEEAHEEALESSRQAESALALLKGLISEGASVMAEPLAMEQELRELLGKPAAFFNYHDASHMAKKIVAECGTIEQEERAHVDRVLRDLEMRSKALLQSREEAKRIIPLARPVLARLRSLREGLEGREPFARLLEQSAALSGALDSVEVTARELKKRAELLRAWVRFFQDFALILFFTATGGLVLLPGAVSFAAALRPGLTLLKGPELWLIQKAVLVAGGFGAIIFALGHTVINRVKTTHAAASRYHRAGAQPGIRRKMARSRRR